MWFSLCDVALSLAETLNQARPVRFDSLLAV
jgi:hypothetical protein